MPETQLCVFQRASVSHCLISSSYSSRFFTTGEVAMTVKKTLGAYLISACVRRVDVKASVSVIQACERPW